MPCTYCNAQFTITKWKSTCSECLKKHCSDCMNGRRCRACNSIMCTNFKRSCLMKTKVKDLQLYLKNRNYAFETCREKRELVELIQRMVGVNEPDLENHTQSYDTSFHTTLGLSEETPVDVPHSDVNINNFQRNSIFTQNIVSDLLAPPSYNETQQSYPTAEQFSSTPNATSSTPGGDNRTHLSENKRTNETKTSQKPSLVELSDLQSIDEIKSLSIQQLKHLLKNNLVNMQGILEKKELVKKVEALYTDNRRDLEAISKQSQENSSQQENDDKFCKICWDNPLNCVLLDCGHMATCIDCGKELRECPICRQHIVKAIRVFKS